MAVRLVTPQLAPESGLPNGQGGAYYNEPIDTYISKYIVSNVELNHTCNT